MTEWDSMTPQQRDLKTYGLPFKQMVNEVKAAARFFGTVRNPDYGMMTLTVLQEAKEMLVLGRTEEGTQLINKACYIVGEYWRKEKEECHSMEEDY